MSESFLPNQIQASSCLACGYHWAIPLFNGGQQPLATLAWPKTAEASVNLPRYPLKFMRCLHCGHIYNQEFEYHQVPYVKHPNLMYNRSEIWQEHLQDIGQRLSQFLSKSPVIIEIGCGEGGFLKLLASIFDGGQFIGFDPNSSCHSSQSNLHLYPELFVPAVHLQQYRPDLILSRHVLEHLMDPLAFIQNLALFSSHYQQQPYLFFEVPCVDRLLEHGRLEDLYYEHNSHFTTRSFTTLLKHLDCQVKFIEKGYNQEVIFGLLQLNTMTQGHKTLEETQHFHQLVNLAQKTILKQVKALCTPGQKVVIWGGTGKGAAFIHHFGLTELTEQLLVVDSDPAKVGTYVPGTALRIESRDLLTELSPSPIIIPAQWRAEDIVIEIKAHQIPHREILIEHQGQIMAFESEAHPYHSR